MEVVKSEILNRICLQYSIRAMFALGVIIALMTPGAKEGGSRFNFVYIEEKG